MSDLRWDHKPELRSPVMIAGYEGWVDAAEAASNAVSYLAGSWGGRPFAGIDPEDFYDFTERRPIVRLDEDLQRHIEWPANVFSAASAPKSSHDVVLFQGIEPHLKWRAYGRAVVEVVDDLGVEMVISVGALLADVPHTRPVRVSGTATTPELIEQFGLMRSRYQGPTGISSVVAEAVSRRGVPVMSLWATVPHYVGANPCPKATLALVRRVAGVIEAAVDVGDLEVASAEYERQVDEVVARDDDIASYVRRLEAAHEEVEPEPPDGEALAAEVERFLREHRPTE